MTAVIEMWTAQARPGERDQLALLLAERALPLQRSLGMRVLGPWPARDDDVTLAWFRGFSDESSRRTLRDALERDVLWTNELERLTSALLDASDVVVIDDPGGLWDRMTPPLADPAAQPVVVGDLASQELRSAELSIYDVPIGVRLLFQDPRSGAEHYLIRYPAGMHGDRHRHSAAHTFIVVEGALLANGTRVGPGSYCHFPAGTVMHHEPAEGEDCLFVAVFDGPQDVQPAT